jgi:hypothetical protein
MNASTCSLTPTAGTSSCGCVWRSVGTPQAPMLRRFVRCASAERAATGRA